MNRAERRSRSPYSNPTACGTKILAVYCIGGLPPAVDVAVPDTHEDRVRAFLHPDGVV